MKLLQQTDSTKLLLKLFLILAAVFVLPTDAFAVDESAYIVWIFISFASVIIPPIIALLIIVLNRNKVELTLILISTIWLLNFLAFYYFFSDPLKEGFITLFWENYLWLPITLVEVIVIIRYIIFKMKSKKV